MELFESHRKKFFRNMLVVFPLLFLLVIASVFFTGVSFTSKNTLQKEQQLLEQSLKRGAVHTYALTGRYPESAEELIKDYHITYDSSRFVIEYVHSVEKQLYFQWMKYLMIYLHRKENGGVRKWQV